MRDPESMFDRLEIAHFWGLKPSEFLNSSPEDQHYMTAFWAAKSKMAAVEAARRDV